MHEINEWAVEIKEEQKGDILVLRLRGRLDALSAPDTEKRVLQAIDRGQNKVLLDFAGVDYISSAGMRMLLATTKKLKNKSGYLILCSVTTNVMDVFKMSGFDHVLELADTEEEGIHKLASRTSA